MADRDEHIRAAEELLARSKELMDEPAHAERRIEMASALAQQAQVHATLAQVLGTRSP